MNQIRLERMIYGWSKWQTNVTNINNYQTYILLGIWIIKERLNLVFKNVLHNNREWSINSVCKNKLHLWVIFHWETFPVRTDTLCVCVCVCFTFGNTFLVPFPVKEDKLSLSFTYGNTFLAIEDKHCLFKLFGLQIFWLWAYPVKVISDTRRAH